MSDASGVRAIERSSITAGGKRAGDMKRCSRQAAFFVGLGLGAATVVAEGAGIATAVQTQRGLHRQVLALKKELRTLGKVQPALTDEISRSINADLANATNALERLRVELTSTGETSEAFDRAPRPVAKADGYFDIAAFVERTRQAAVDHEVRLRPDERFGFAAYEHSGPETDALPTVFRERYAAEYLLRTLFESRPYSLVGVQRERRVNDVRTVVARDSTETASLADTFEWDERGSSRTSAVDSSMLKISFVAETVTLRALLNRLGEFELPLVVRAVEIQPEAAERAKAAATSGRDAETPLVPRSMSRFSVTVELIRLLVSAGGEL